MISQQEIYVEMQCKWNTNSCHLNRKGLLPVLQRDLGSSSKPLRNKKNIRSRVATVARVSNTWKEIAIVFISSNNRWSKTLSKISPTKNERNNLRLNTYYIDPSLPQTAIEPYIAYVLVV